MIDGRRMLMDANELSKGGLSEVMLKRQRECAVYGEKKAYE